MIAAAAIAAGAWATPTAAAGQAPAASAQTRTLPRTTDGKPDLSGIWQVMNTASWDIQDHPAQKGVPAGQGVVEGNDIPYLPAAAAKKQQNFANRATADRALEVLSAGCAAHHLPALSVSDLADPHGRRDFLRVHPRGSQIYIDGSPHPPGHIDWWMGDSRGRWEGDTLVVDVVDFNDEHGSIAPAISTATPCTWSNATRSPIAIISTTK